MTSSKIIGTLRLLLLLLLATLQEVETMGGLLLTVSV